MNTAFAEGRVHFLQERKCPAKEDVCLEGHIQVYGAQKVPKQ